MSLQQGGASPFCIKQEREVLLLKRPGLSVPPSDLLPSSASSSSSSSTMESSGLLQALLLLSLLWARCHGQAPPDVSADDFQDEKLDPAADQDLVEALEVLLGRIHGRVSSTEKRGSIPLCGMGGRCAVKFGPRIGKLCDCGRGANCNSYLLKCI
ncbi:cocaine- and amphetamine-regulated transcript-like isoform X1 [Xiphophorus couchianus]|nr:cocaine- and amphetamine-regulated transcript protein-like isoform X1 [Xiphophorus couchianus]